jgi:hypothetical protein
MAQIKVQGKSEDKETFIFNVELIEDGTKTGHTVEISRSQYEGLTGGRVAPEELVEKSFAFSLEREPSESILRRFNLTKVSYHFPEYEKEVKNCF